MKGLLRLTMPVLVAMSLWACQKNDSNSNNNAVVAQPPPPNVSCINGQAGCDNSLYNNYYGYRAYGNPYFSGYGNGYYGYGQGGYGGGYGYGNSFCNCPSGYRPVYNGGMGLGCVALNYIQPYASAAFYWGVQGSIGGGSNNYHWVNMSQVSNIDGYPTRNSCYDNVALSCFLDQPNTCGAGYTCRATSGGSRLGICSR